MKEEFWRRIDVAPHYEISNWGNVRHHRIKRNIRLRNAAKSDRQYVLLNEGGKQLTLYIDDLVERHFASRFSAKSDRI